MVTKYCRITKWKESIGGGVTRKPPSNSVYGYHQMTYESHYKDKQRTNTKSPSLENLHSGTTSTVKPYVLHRTDHDTRVKKWWFRYVVQSWRDKQKGQNSLILPWHRKKDQISLSFHWNFWGNGLSWYSLISITWQIPCPNTVFISILSTKAAKASLFLQEKCILSL